jgi:hypothetical protein
MASWDDHRSAAKKSASPARGSAPAWYTHSVELAPPQNAIYSEKVFWLPTFHAFNYSSATSASAAGSVALAFWSSFVFLRRTDLIPNHRTHEWILQVTQSSGHTLASPTGGSWVQTSKTCGGCCISRANLRGLLHTLQCAPSGRSQHHKHRRCTPFIACMTQNVMAAQDKKRRNFSKRQKWPIAVEERI